ncbi:mediator of RNA polymerase II transcription subunit 4-like [Octopus vulgaris]|uniref:Mediator of RNA polymerase II transcription subunit 4 n=1 Tax=Octopus vulgaris TaxID=6645 RepID=A0AA36BP61_OCTVU|nr:mediator of RNA polymerase II transcription subunit 4-like [Octopus vulgaris]
MAAISTKQKLLTLIDDIEIVSKELFDVMSTPKNQKTDAPDPALLMELLVQKDKEMKESLKLAEEQMDIQKIMDELKMEVEKRDTDIRNLQKNFKEAETILATAIYQAKQKLNSIAQANKKTISSEELIKFAHRISASNAIAAPVTWAPGDPRRPYPTDFEMRHGYLDHMQNSQSNTLNWQSSSLQPPLAPPPQPPSSSVPSLDPPTPMFGLSASGLNTSMGSGVASSAGLSESIRNHASRDNEDVEIMSSDSSSSSSSDEENP